MLSSLALVAFASGLVAASHVREEPNFEYVRKKIFPLNS